MSPPQKHEMEVYDLQLPDFALEIEYNDEGEITLPAGWKLALYRHMLTSFDELCTRVTDTQNDLEFWGAPAKWAAEAKIAKEEAEGERQMDEGRLPL